MPERPSSTGQPSFERGGGGERTFRAAGEVTTSRRGAFVVDRPGHGRSPHHPGVLGSMGPQLGYEFLRPIFVPPPEGPDSHPTAHLHTHGMMLERNNAEVLGVITDRVTRKLAR